MFQVGFARVDITPPLGTEIAGYFNVRYADGILDPLELNAIAATDGENTVVFIAGDVIYVVLTWADAIREKIAQATGLPVEHIFIQGLHQHTAIRVGWHSAVRGKASAAKDPDYLDVLFRKFCDVARMAIDDMADAKAGVAQKELAEPISFIRRYRMKDGSTRTNPGNLNPDVVGPIGEADNTVRLIRFQREGKRDIALVGFQTHPDVISGNKFSADWPGFVRRYTEEAMPDVHCILINGPQGDTNHIDITKPAIAKKGDPDFAEKRYAFSAKMGKMISDAAISLWDQTRPVRTTPVTGQTRLQYVPTNTKHMERVEEFKKKKADSDAGIIKVTEMGEKTEMNRVCRLPEESLFQKVPSSLMCMGEIGIMGLGGEPFTQYATAAREMAPDMFMLSACLVNGGQGYLPTREAFEEGGYEAAGTSFTAPLYDMLVGSIREMLEEHRKKL